MKPIKIFLLAALTLSTCGFLLYACAKSDAEPVGASPRDSVKPSSPSPSPDKTSPEVDKTSSAMSGEERERRRITIKDNGFVVDGEKPIWINGTNTPWNKWNDFGGGYDDAWWDEHFAALNENGVNAVRVWVNCNNDQNAVLIGSDGMVSGVSDKHWADLDLFFATAERHGIYIMATITSFDHFKSTGAEKWRTMISSAETIDTFVEHYTIPFVNRYKDNPYLWSIDLCNEPDWIHEEEACGNLQWEDISHFFARNTAAIHENSDVLVTVGMAFPKYNADGAGYEGNKVSDAYLQGLYANENAYLDFWSTHYYDWVGEWYGVPFTSSPSGARPEGWGLDGSKPALLGECSARGSVGSTLKDDYENAMQNGWQGVMPWTSNGVDANGGFDQLAPVTKHMAEKYRDLIFPMD